MAISDNIAHLKVSVMACHNRKLWMNLLQFGSKTMWIDCVKDVNIHTFIKKGLMGLHALT